jgi:hypothetical protein
LRTRKDIGMNTLFHIYNTPLIKILYVSYEMTQTAVDTTPSDGLFQIVGRSGDQAKNIAHGFKLADIEWKKEGLMVKGHPLINVDRIYWKSY